MGLDPEGEYLSVGVAQGVHTSLARIPELIVSAWPTVVKLRSEGLDAADIAGKLKAPNFLDGAVQKAGDRIRITARLVAGESGRTIWSETYDGPVADIFAIQDEIAAAVSSNLRVGRSTALPSTQRTNPKTYRLTLQAWSILHRASQGSTGSIAMALADEALARDPDYLLALNAMMLAAYQQQMDGEISEAEAGAIYRDVRERILAIDPENSIANSYLAWELFWDEKEFAHANHHLQVALRTGLNHQESLRLLAGFARRTGNTEAAVHVGERALAIDPTCENCMWQETENLFYAGRFEEAIEGKKRIQKLGMGGYHNHAVMLLMNDQTNAALDLIAASTSPEVFLQGYLLACAGRCGSPDFVSSICQ